MPSAGLATLAATILAISPGTVLHAQRVVRETATLWQQAKPLTLAPQQRWCASADAPGCDLRNMDMVTAMPDGGILANDVQGPLYRFAADGKFVGPMSRKGQGPGEYGFLVSPHVLDGRIIWFDNTQMRLASIGLDGVPGPVVRLMPPQTMANIFAVGGELVILDVPTAARLGDTVVASYRTVPAAGAPRVLARVRTPSLFTPGSDMRRMAPAFSPRVVSDVGSAGDVAHSNGDRYVVEMFPASGAGWRLEIDAPRRQVTRADRDSAMARATRAFRVTSPAALPADVRSALLSPPGAHPPISAIRVLRDGTVWIRLTSTVEERDARWDVFRRDGTRMGRVTLPAAARVQDGTKDWVLVVQPGDDDVPQAVRYTIR
ncbi:MAG: hypothetical protein V4617_18580 [Gemmatimonadota bacterium]